MLLLDFAARACAFRYLALTLRAPVLSFFLLALIIYRGLITELFPSLLLEDRVIPRGPSIGVPHESGILSGSYLIVASISGKLKGLAHL